MNCEIEIRAAKRKLMSWPQQLRRGSVISKRLSTRSEQVHNSSKKALHSFRKTLRHCGRGTETECVCRGNRCVHEQMSASIARVKTNAEQADRLAKRTDELARNGGEAVRRSIESMRLITEKSRQVSEIIEVISETRVRRTTCSHCGDRSCSSWRTWARLLCGS